jgi:hypothetical protein
MVQTSASNLLQRNEVQEWATSNSVREASQATLASTGDKPFIEATPYEGALWAKRRSREWLIQHDYNR